MSSFWASDPLILATLVGAILSTGLTSGLLYAFAHSVMPGLATLDDTGFVRGFQRIDAAIGNPWMGLAFAGSPVLTLAALLLHLRDGGSALVWLAVALALVLATTTITAVVHLPLNATLQAAAPELADAPSLREHFEDRWVRWNIARTITSVGSFACPAVVLLLNPPAA